MTSNNSYVIECRYEYWSMSDGKTWTRWFRTYNEIYPTRESAIKQMKEEEKKTMNTDRVTRLRHEFRVQEI